jgi:hypothetical protein
VNELILEIVECDGRSALLEFQRLENLKATTYKRKSFSAGESGPSYVREFTVSRGNLDFLVMSSPFSSGKRPFIPAWRGALAIWLYRD